MIPPPIVSRFRVHGALLALAWLIALAVPCTLATAQPLQASVALSRDSVDLGDNFILQVTIDGASSAQPPSLPASEAYKAEFLGGRDESSHSIMTINGRTTESTTKRYVMQWSITPLRGGQGEVGGFTIQAEGQSLSIPPTTFRAAPPGVNPRFELRLECDRVQAYVGEPVRLRLVWSLGAGARGASVSGPDGGQDFDIAATDPRPPRTRSTPIQNNDPYRVVPFLGGQAVLSRAQGELHGVTVPTFSMNLVVTPRRAGRLEIGPYRVAFDEVTGQKQRSFFDSPFDDLSVTKRAVVSSEPVVLEVKPLPEDGRPADFSGLVGVYSLEASAGNSEANVGDPVPFSLTIHGPEPLGALKAPALDAQPDFAARFKPAPEGWDVGAVDDSTPGQRTFNTTIRPTRADVAEIPPVRLPYFDTAAGRYEVALSKPIALTVHASKEFTLADAQRPGAGTLPALAPATLTNAPPGIHANSESLDALTDQRVNILGAIRSPGGIGLLGVPPAVLGIVSILAHRRRRADPGRLARRAAIHDARARLRSAQGAQDVAGAIRVALAPVLGCSPQAVASSDAAGSGESAARDAGSLLADLEASTFDSRAIDLSSARARAATVLTELEP